MGGWRQDAAATFEKTQSVEALETHGGELFAEGGDGGSGKLVGGLFGNAERCTDFAVALAIADAFGHESESGRKRRHCRFEAFPGFQGGGMIDQRDIMRGNLLDTGFRGGGGLGDREIKVVNVVPVVPDLPFVEIAQGVAHGAGGVSGEVALGRIVSPGRMGESLLSRQFYLSMRQSGDVIELPGDLCSEGKEFIYPLFHEAEMLLT